MTPQEFYAMQDAEAVRSVEGIRAGLVLSLPFWVAVAMVAGVSAR
ncbi:hypothetical protein BH09ACT9_BH09ACT9_00070 [soil metagenome]